jgi:cytoskeletal protein CcmA (bactofilin family)
MERPAEIGASIVVRGELSAREDIVISGRVEGSVEVIGHAVTVTRGAQVVADIEARAIVVGGQVMGALCAEERVELRETADVEGEIEAPKLKMAEGAIFKGKAETKGLAKPGLQLAS